MEKLKQNTITFHADRHRYTTPEGKELISVTTLLNIMGLSPDFSSVPAAVLEAAAERGTAIHKQVEEHFTSDTDLPLELCTEVGRELSKYRWNIVATEYIVSDNQLLAGAIDLIHYDQERDMYDIIDIKTSKQSHTDYYRWQLSIYRRLMGIQCPDIRLGKIYVLHMHDIEHSRLEEMELVPESDIDNLIKAYLELRPYTPAPLLDKHTELDVARQTEALTAYIEQAKEDIRKKEEELQAVKQKVQQLMQQHKITRWELPTGLVFTRVAATSRKSVDTKRLKAEQPDIYERYLLESEVAETIRINRKKAKNEELSENQPQDARL